MPVVVSPQENTPDFDMIAYFQYWAVNKTKPDSGAVSCTSIETVMRTLHKFKSCCNSVNV